MAGEHNGNRYLAGILQKDPVYYFRLLLGMKMVRPDGRARIRGTAYVCDSNL
jgi:hypothetical protein